MGTKMKKKKNKEISFIRMAIKSNPKCLTSCLTTNKCVNCPLQAMYKDSDEYRKQWQLCLWGYTYEQLHIL